LFISGKFCSKTLDVLLCVSHTFTVRECLAASMHNLEELNRSILLHPYSSSCHHERGLYYDNHGEYSKAIADYTRAIELNPEPIFYYNRALSHTKSGDTQRGITDYTNAITKNPSRALFYLERGKVYTDVKMYDQALEDFNNVVTLDPNEVEGFYNRGRLLRIMGRMTESLADLQTTITKNPTDAYAFGQMAHVYFNLKQYTLAIMHAEKAIAMDAENVLERPHFVLGCTYHAKEKYDLAEKCLKKFLAFKPSSVWYPVEVEKAKMILNQIANQTEKKPPSPEYITTNQNSDEISDYHMRSKMDLEVKIQSLKERKQRLVLMDDFQNAEILNSQITDLQQQLSQLTVSIKEEGSKEII